MTKLMASLLVKDKGYCIHMHKATYMYTEVERHVSYACTLTMIHM